MKAPFKVTTGDTKLCGKENDRLHKCRDHNNIEAQPQ
jgi:hypothetical protein